MITFAYKLYNSRRNKHLNSMLKEASAIWNRALSIQRRYYSLFGSHINCARMKAHFAKRPSRQLLSAVSVQEILERQELAFTRFFEKKAKRPPKFKKPSDFCSIVFKCGKGYKLYGNEIIINRIKKKFKFFYSRPYTGVVKRLQVSRKPSGDYYVYITTNFSPENIRKSHDGASIGMDFGLKTFLTLSNGEEIVCPRFLEMGLRKIRMLSKNMSEVKSNNTRLRLNKAYERIKNQRNDWQWKTAHSLCKKFDYIYVEDLNLVAMGKMGKWGRKVYDYAYGGFLEKLGYVSSKYGVSVRQIDRLYPSSKTCGNCGHVNKHLSLKDRCWTCPECGSVLNRDLNAAMNILRQGVVSSKSVRKSSSLVECDCIRESENLEYAKAVEIPENIGINNI